MMASLQRRRESLVLVGWVLLLALSGMPALAETATLQLQPVAGSSGAFVALDAVEGTEPITLVARFRTDSRDAMTNVRGMWLAGFSDRPDAPPTVLSLTWSEDTAGWFPFWGLQLQGGADLFPTSLRAQRGAGFLAGSSYLNLQALTPQYEHLYEAALSYDPVSGRAAVSVRNLTTGDPPIARSFTLAPYSGTLYPVLGVEGEGHGLEVLSFDVSLSYVPFGTTWELMEQGESVFSRLVVSRITQDVALGLRLQPESDAWDGQYRLVAEGEAGSVTILNVPAGVAATDTIPFPAADLPMGEIVAALQYVDATNRIWPLGGRRLQVVAGTLRIDFGPLVLDGEQLVGTVTLSSDDNVRDIGFTLSAVLTKLGDDAGEAVPLLDQRLSHVSSARRTFPFSMPVPTEDAVIRIVMEPTFDVPVGRMIKGNEYHIWIR